MLRRNPGFTAVAVLTLALGIGANTAIFSVVYAVVLKPLPYAHSEQLFNVFQAKPQDGVTGTGWSYLNYTELRDHNDVFSDTAGAQKHQLTLTGRGEPSVVDTSVVTAGFFSLFGEKALAGRTFNADDGKRGAAPVAILSEDLWRGYFGGDPQRDRDVDRSRQEVVHGRRDHAVGVPVPVAHETAAAVDPARPGSAVRRVARSAQGPLAAGYGSIEAGRHDGAGAGETGRD